MGENGEVYGRLTQREQFQRVSRGARAPAPAFTLQFRHREEADLGQKCGARIGLTVTKNVGGAVERNRVRRRVKEALRAAAPLEAESDHDYVLVARSDALGRRFAALVDDLRRAFRTARRVRAEDRKRTSAARTVND